MKKMSRTAGKNSAHTLLLCELYPTLKQWVVNKMGNNNSCQPLHVRNTATCSSHSVIVHYLCLMQTLVTVTIHFRKIITIWKILWELKFPISLKCDQNYNKNKTPSRRKPTPSRACKQRKHTSFWDTETGGSCTRNLEWLSFSFALS